MFVSVITGGLALFFLPFAAPDCATPCPTTYELRSMSVDKSYGILIEAPVHGCRRVRYEVSDPKDGRLGHTPPLGPGEVAVIRIGRGFSAGGHVLTVSAKGCALPPQRIRRVVLGKPSPDHGWRSAG